MRHKSANTSSTGRLRDTHASYNYERARISVESGFTNYATLLRHRLAHRSDEHRRGTS